jgi:formylglycine-generating enzyme required for sulfatase activity
MEWMFAAKGGNLSQGFIYSGSNDANSVAWYSSNSGNSSHIVGTKAGNELGIYDMSGNLSEWVWDIWEDMYPSSNQTNPVGPISGLNRVIRNGSWSTPEIQCSVQSRGFSNTIDTNYHYGFRVVMACY